ncbi:15283_t:CDS:1, partial [Acaulospora morrowiae]
MVQLEELLTINEEEEKMIELKIKKIEIDQELEKEQQEEVKIFLKQE